MFFFSQPRWKTPDYSKRQINNAGTIIRNPNAAEEDRNSALAVIDNWRAAHAYPMHVFYMNLRRKTEPRADVLVAERLKRLDSIVSKLQREPGMELYRMQDLGGCRLIVPTIKDVQMYSDKFQHSRIRHELKKVNDYIQTPKLSGYRSLHLIYRFKTDTPEKNIYNQYPMLIELQFRTHLQHLWATAVETIGLFTNQALKSGQGDEAIKRFFIVVSSLFALKEKCPVAPGTVCDENELISEIEMINDQHHILEMLRAIRVAIEREASHLPDKRGYYILQLNYENHTLRKWYFKPSEIDDASIFYDYLESHKGDSPLDIVLIRASSIATVKAAYPNYFLDIGEFVDIIANYLK